MLAVERAGGIAGDMMVEGDMGDGEGEDVLERLRSLHLILQECSKRVDRVDVALQARPSLKSQSPSRDTLHCLTKVVTSTQNSEAAKKCHENSSEIDSNSFEDIFTEASTGEDIFIEASTGEDIFTETSTGNKDCVKAELYENCIDLDMSEENGSIVLEMWGEGKSAEIDKRENETDTGVYRDESNDNEGMMRKGVRDPDDKEGSIGRGDVEVLYESDSFQEGTVIQRHKRRQPWCLVKQTRLELDDSEMNDMMNAGFVIAPQLSNNSDRDCLKKSSVSSGASIDTSSLLWPEARESVDFIDLLHDECAERLVVEEHTVAVSQDTMIVSLHDKESSGFNKNVPPNSENQINILSEIQCNSQKSFPPTKEAQKVKGQGIQDCQDDLVPAEQGTNVIKIREKDDFCHTDVLDQNTSDTTQDNIKVESLLVDSDLNPPAVRKTVERGTQFDEFFPRWSSGALGGNVGYAVGADAENEMKQRGGTDVNMRAGKGLDSMSKNASPVDTERLQKQDINTWMRQKTYPDCNSFRTFDFPQLKTSWGEEVRIAVRSLVVALLLLLFLLVLAFYLLLVVPVVSVSVRTLGGPPAF